MTRLKRFKRHSFYVWHRYIGLTCVTPIIGLVITGLLLQHSDLFNLSSRYPNAVFISALYDLQPDKVNSYKTENHWVSQSGSALFLDMQPIDGVFETLNGAIETEFGLAVATGSEINLITNKGELIDSLTPGNGLPDAAQALAIIKSNIIIKGVNRNWKTDSSFLNWQAYEAEVNWIEPANAPLEIAAAVQKHSLSRQISWERMLLDLHSGRLFGKFGIWIVDAAAIGMLILTCTGCWLWVQRLRKQKQRSIARKRGS